MSETLYGLEARMLAVKNWQDEAAGTTAHRAPTPPPSPSRHRLAERLRRMADRLDG